MKNDKQLDLNNKFVIYNKTTNMYIRLDKLFLVVFSSTKEIEEFIDRFNSLFTPYDKNNIVIVPLTKEIISSQNPYILYSMIPEKVLTSAKERTNILYGAK